MTDPSLSGNEALAKGVYDAGVKIATGYPGFPSTRFLEYLIETTGEEVYVEWSANEKVAFEIALGGSMAGVRTAVCFKCVGLNVAMDPLMVASIVARESSFRSRVVSRAGAVGLMQLRPFVAEQVAQKSRIEWNGLQTLHSPDHNVRLGILYYKQLLERFDGDAEVALTAYLYGPTRVGRQLSRGTYRGSSYADDILGLYAKLSDRRSGGSA